MSALHTYGLYAAILCWSLGIILNQVHEGSIWALWWLYALIFVCVWRCPIVTLVCASACGAGWLHYELYHELRTAPIAEKSRTFIFTREGEEREVLGVIVTKPQCTKGVCEFTVVHTDDTPVRGVRVYVKTKRLLDSTNLPQYGDAISVYGRVLYAHKKHHRKHVFVEMKAAEVRSVDVFVGSYWSVTSIIRNLYSFRDGFTSTVHAVFSSPHSHLLSGLVIEGGASLPSDLRKQFSATGLSHIVALSGFNVTIIVEAVFFMLSRCNRSLRITLGSLFVIGFGVMTGLSSPIVRATIMALIQLTGELLYRRYHPLRALLVSGFV